VGYEQLQLGATGSTLTIKNRQTIVKASDSPNYVTPG